MREKWTCSAVGTYIRKVCVLACWISCWLQSAIVFFFIQGSSFVFLSADSTCNYRNFALGYLFQHIWLLWYTGVLTATGALMIHSYEPSWLPYVTKLYTRKECRGKPWKWSTLVTKSCSVSIYNLEGIVSF